MSHNKRFYGFVGAALLGLLSTPGGSFAFGQSGFESSTLDSREVEELQARIDGTGVGSATDGEFQATATEMRRRLGHRDQPTQAYLAQPHQQLNDIISWCQIATDILEEERDTALILYHRGEYDAAINILKQALSTVSSSFNVGTGQFGPLTQKLADRGSMIIDELRRRGVLKDSDNITKEALLKFLFSFVDTIIRLENDFDRTWYIPYNYSYHRCVGEACPEQFSFIEFKDQYLKSIISQLTFTKSLVSTSGGQVFPVGRPMLYLTVTEMIVGWSAQDIGDTLPAYSEGCAIKALRKISRDLYRFNDMKSKTVFANSGVATKTAAYIVALAVADITTNDCGGW